MYLNHQLQTSAAPPAAEGREGGHSSLQSIIYIYLYKSIFPKQCLHLRGSYLSSIVIPLAARIAGRQVPKPRCLSPAANSLYSRIAGRQVPKPRCLSPAVNSMYSRIAGCQSRYLSLGT